jgi:hypothetical protein
METKRTLNTQSNSEQNNQCCSYHNIEFQIVLHSHSSTIEVGTKTDTQTNGLEQQAQM